MACRNSYTPVTVKHGPSARSKKCFANYSLLGIAKLVRPELAGKWGVI
jgi:hypothetical protein